MQPDEPTTDESQQNLPQDGGTPAEPATPPVGDNTPTDGSQTPPVDDTSPATDTGVDATEANDEGVSGTVETQTPGADSNPAEAVDSASNESSVAPEEDTEDTTQPPAEGVS